MARGIRVRITHLFPSHKSTWRGLRKLGPPPPGVLIIGRKDTQGWGSPPTAASGWLGDWETWQGAGTHLESRVQGHIWIQPDSPSPPLKHVPPPQCLQNKAQALSGTGGSTPHISPSSITPASDRTPSVYALAHPGPCPRGTPNLTAPPSSGGLPCFLPVSGSTLPQPCSPFPDPPGGPSLRGSRQVSPAL